MGFATVVPVLTNVDTTAIVAPGTRYIDDHGNEYIYALGIGSTVAGSVVRLTLSSDTLITALLTETLAALGGMLGVAMAATIASTYGWYQIYGMAEVSLAANCATNVTMFATSSGGVIDDAGTTRLHGIWVQDTITTAANTTCLLSYPHCNKVA
jgi:hypothetical protein